MPAPTTALAALHAEYSDHATQSALTLTLDQRRGVAFYLADTDDAVEVESFVRRWTDRVHDLDDFVDKHGGMPRADSTRPRPATAEQTLVDTLTYFRQVGAAGGYCSYQVRRLEAVPGFAWNPRDAQWSSMLAAHQQFWVNHQRPPRRRATDPAEVTIGRWVAQQRAQHARGRLLPEREQQLRAARFRVL